MTLPKKPVDRYELVWWTRRSDYTPKKHRAVYYVDAPYDEVQPDGFGTGQGFPKFVNEWAIYEMTDLGIWQLQGRNPEWKAMEPANDEKGFEYVRFATEAAAIASMRAHIHSDITRHLVEARDLKALAVTYGYPWEEKP